MMRAAAMVLVLSMVVVARHAGGEGPGRFATMALGFVLIVAALAGEAGERFKLPRLTGYLLVGFLLGPAVMDLITPQMTGQLRLINGLAVALIAFGAGMELELSHLRRQWGSLMRHGLVLISVLFAGLFTAALLATPWIPFVADLPWSSRAAVALVTAAVMSTFSPMVTMAVLAETRAKGPLSDRVLALVVLGDLVVVLLFTFSTMGARLLDGRRIDLGAEVSHVTWEVLGSLALGAAVGVAIYFYRRLVDQRSGLVVAGTCLLLAEVGIRVGLSPLLACLMAGLVVRNAAPEAAHEMDELLSRVRMPVMVVFFAAAGASLHLSHLMNLWPIVLGLVLVRGSFIHVGNAVGGRFSATPPEISRQVPSGLISQAGVTLGLAVIVGRDFGDWGLALETLFVATISLHELIGPVLFRRSLLQSGEVPDEGQETPAPAVV